MKVNIALAILPAVLAASHSANRTASHCANRTASQSAIRSAVRSTRPGTSACSAANHTSTTYTHIQSTSTAFTSTATFGYLVEDTVVGSTTTIDSYCQFRGTVLSVPSGPTSTIITATETVIAPASATATPRPSVTTASLPDPTVCGFTPIRYEPQYTDPSQDAVLVIPTLSTTFVVTSSTVTTVSTVCGLGSTTEDSTYTYTPYVKQNATTTSTCATAPTSYAACKRSNVVTKGPEGQDINDHFFLFAGRNVSANVIDQPYPYSLTSPGITASPEECCNFCQGQPICYGSTWVVNAFNSENRVVVLNGTCTIYTPGPNGPSPFCDASATAMYFYPSYVDPVLYRLNSVAVSNGNCGQFTPVSGRQYNFDADGEPQPGYLVPE